MNKDEIDIPHIYDTPTGIIEKEGNMWRGMTTYNSKRSLWLRALIIFFSFIILILPGLLLIYIGGAVIYLALNKQETLQIYPLLISIIVGLPLLIGGMKAVYQNSRK